MLNKLHQEINFCLRLLYFPSILWYSFFLKQPFFALVHSLEPLPIPGRMAVSLRVVQVCARMITRSLSIQGFKASWGWVEKFIRRNGIQSSIKLHGKANAKLPEGHRARIGEIKSIPLNTSCQTYATKMSQSYFVGSVKTGVIFYALNIDLEPEALVCKKQNKK